MMLLLLAALTSHYLWMMLCLLPAMPLGCFWLMLFLLAALTSHCIWMTPCLL